MAETMPRRIAADHPAIAGHFPGDPLVPGVLILEEVFEALVETIGPARLVGVRSVKFLAPVRPEETFEVRFHDEGDQRYAFTCSRDGQILARGSLQLASPDR